MPRNQKDKPPSNSRKRDLPDPSLIISGSRTRKLTSKAMPADSDRPRKKGKNTRAQKSVDDCIQEPLRSTEVPEKDQVINQSGPLENQNVDRIRAEAEIKEAKALAKEIAELFENAPPPLSFQDTQSSGRKRDKKCGLSKNFNPQLDSK